MAAHTTALSPTSTSPRKPLQNLSTNTSLTPKQDKARHASPFKSTVNFIPTTLTSVKETCPIDFGPLNASRKRTLDEADLPTEGREGLDNNSVEEHVEGPSNSSQIRASFSSLINYDAHASSSSTSNSQQTVQDGEEQVDLVKDRANILKLRLQMAMFRVKTDQVTVPLSSLKLPEPPESLLLLDPRLRSPSTPLEKQEAKRQKMDIRDDGDESDDLPIREQEDEMETEEDDDDIQAGVERDLTSSAVKGKAVSGLLELRRSA